jgi:SbcC/RAD50-like, Walker B motif/P-loop containing region of AAA domain
MYLLEKFHLVQFYLFSATTLHFGKSSAIVAPNGSGKSAVLDAMQIVLHGGDQKAIDLNAQSGGSKTGRSIREYLLGFYRDDENVRDHATSYLTMVFRDSTGQLPVVSLGLCLGATLSEPRHRVYGMYILPGVDLALEEHTQTVQGQLAPLAWPEFKELITERTLAAGEKPEFPRDRIASDFVERMLYRLHGSRSIDNVAFSKALKNALNLKDVHDASAFVRDRIIEERPISIAEFRNQLETFRDLKQKIADVIERIKVGGQVLEFAKRAIETRMRKASYGALIAELRRDGAMEQLDEALEVQGKAEEAFEAAQSNLTRTKLAHDATEGRLKDITDQARLNPDLQRHQIQTAERERGLTPLKKNLATELRRVVTAFTAAKARDPEANGWSFLAKPWESLLERIAAAAGGDSLRLDPAAEAARLSEAQAGCQPLLEAVRKREAVDTAEMERAKQRLKTALQQLERVKTGKSQVPDEVITVRNLLQDQGIEATPVCDLVSVTDTNWAPAIEGYLRSNTYALLVEPGREDDAIRIYEEIPEGYNPFGVKIVQPRRQAHNTTPLPAKALAHLITGENEHAVNFLRSRLRRLIQLDVANSRADDGLTRKGTLVNNGTIERLRVPAAGDVLLGKQDVRAKVDLITREKQARDREYQEAEHKARASAGLLEAIGPLVGLRDLIENLQRWLEEHRDLEQSLDDAQRIASLQDNPDLVAMQELLDAAQGQYDTAKQAHHLALQTLGSAETQLQTANARYEELKVSADQLAREASMGMQQPFVDAGWIDERRTDWERQGKTLEEMIKTCGDGLSRESTAYGTQESDMRTSLRDYVNHYHQDFAVDPSNPDGVRATMDVEIKRLQDSELAVYQQQADDAYVVAVRTFRSRIAASLRSSFDDMANQLRELNSIMARMPAFTNDERYHFKWWVNPEHKTLHTFIRDVADRGGEDSLFEDPVNTPDEFRALLEDASGPSQELLRDYRKFFSFEVEVRHQGQTISTLKSRMEKGSGGEHRAPLFVVAGAALAAAYGKLQGDTSGMSLILFDELGDKIDGNNTKAVFEYLRSLGLQPIVAAPDDALGKINESVEGYVELYREGSFLAVNHVGLGPNAHELLTSDSWVKHPELLESETRNVIAERGLTS